MCRGPFEGVGTFEYTTQAGSKLDTATVTVLVHPISSPEEAPPVDVGDGWAKNDSVCYWNVAAPICSVLIVMMSFGRSDGAEIIEINGFKVEPGDTIDVGWGTVTISDKGHA